MSQLEKQAGGFELKGTIRMPADIQCSAVPLLDQQMWCWGCDVRRAQGNLLLAYGAEKRPSPDARYHSAYTFQTEEGAVLNLWGWGIWFAQLDQGSLFIGRSRFRMRYSPEVIRMPDAWCARDLPPMIGARDETAGEPATALLAAALNWIGGYEQWLCSQVGPDYREHILEKWPKRKRHKGGIPAAQMSTRWFELSTRIAKEPLHS